MRFIPILLAAAASSSPVIAASPVKMEIVLTGPAEVPGPGSNGKGTASLTFDSDKGQLCYMLMSSGTDAPTMAHIHKGAAGVAGSVVVPLAPPVSGMAEGCAPVVADTLSAMMANPADYYVNIHSATFPKGALRGQLK